MARLAFFTLNVAREPFSSPQLKGFVERIEAILAQASATHGFLDFPPAMRVGKDDPELVWPDAKPAEAEAAMTLSLWRDLDSVFSFAFAGLHAEALRLRREWTVAPDWPTYVAWWVDDDEEPTWHDAAQRHEWLRTRGSTADAFDFRAPFDAQGQPTPPVRKPLGLIPSAHTGGAEAERGLIAHDFDGALPLRAQAKHAIDTTPAGKER